jgi:hypothetical protein
MCGGREVSLLFSSLLRNDFGCRTLSAVCGERVRVLTLIFLRSVPRPGGPGFTLSFRAFSEKTLGAHPFRGFCGKGGGFDFDSLRPLFAFIYAGRGQCLFRNDFGCRTLSAVCAERVRVLTLIFLSSVPSFTCKKGRTALTVHPFQACLMAKAAMAEAAAVEAGAPPEAVVEADITGINVAGIRVTRLVITAAVVAGSRVACN